MEQVEIGEVHHTERDHQRAKLTHEDLKHLDQHDFDASRLQRHENVSEVQQIEPHDQQVIHCGDQARIVVEDIVEKNPTAPEERACEPEGETDADSGVSDVHSNEILNR